MISDLASSAVVGLRHTRCTVPPRLAISSAMHFPSPLFAPEREKHLIFSFTLKRKKEMAIKTNYMYILTTYDSGKTIK